MEQESQSADDKNLDNIPEIIRTQQPNEIVIKHEVIVPERPELLHEFEKYNPGFMKQVSENFLELDEENRRQKFRFSKFQAYTSLILLTSIGIIAISVIAYISLTGKATFWNSILIGFALLLSVGRDRGITKIIDAVSRRIRNSNLNNN